MKVKVANWPSFVTVTFVPPTLSDHSMLEMATPFTGSFVVRYSLKFLSVLEATVTRSPSGVRAVFAMYQSFAKFGAGGGVATGAVATANGERFIIGS